MHAGKTVRRYRRYGAIAVMQRRDRIFLSIKMEASDQPSGLNRYKIYSLQTYDNKSTTIE